MTVRLLIAMTITKVIIMGMICDAVTSYDNKKDDYGDDFDMLLAGTVTRVMILGNDHLDNRNT